MTKLKVEEAPTQTQTPTPDTPAPVLTDGLTGDYGTEDVASGYLTLVSGSSKLAKEFLTGHWVADKAHDLGTEVEVIFLACDKAYEEASSGDDLLSDPLRWDTLAAAKESGHLYQATAQIALVVRIKEGAPGYGDCWFYDADGTGYLPLNYSVRGSKSNAHGGNYGTVVKTLNRDVKVGWLAKVGLGCGGGIYKLYSTSESYNGNDYNRARIQPAGTTTPELRHLILEKTGR